MSECGLCKKEKELKNSHLMPKSLYKAVRNAFPEKGKEILLGKSQKRSVTYSDHQVKRPFLCGDCEQKFNKEGENVVTKECYRGKNEFILLENIQQEKELFKLKDQRWIDPNKIGNIDFESYAYLH